MLSTLETFVSPAVLPRSGQEDKEEGHLTHPCVFRGPSCGPEKGGTYE